MYYTRTTHTASEKTAVQIVEYQGKHTRVIKHIGSAASDEEVKLLKEQAHLYIRKITGQIPLFPLNDNSKSKILHLNKIKYLGFRYTFLYETIYRIFSILKFNSLTELLTDFVLIRIVEPTSKLRSLELLEEWFGRKYKKSSVFKKLLTFILLKEEIEKLIVNYARKHLSFDFTLVFYDVTTLYFETDNYDDFRNFGYSKDNKGSQPQIVIGLLVNKDGFPLYFEIFEGRTFEGHTLIPSVKAIKQKYDIKDLTVVADAAMISIDNIKLLKEHFVNYIVGARLGNLKHALLEEISETLPRKDQSSIRLVTSCGDLICDYSLKRFTKDSREMEKQIKKANIILNDPSRILKRCKFIRGTRKTRYAINEELIEKTRKLLGIKGYYTNLNLPNEDVIEQYHYLWTIERSFRIAKSDLKIRPVFHRKRDTIRVHVLICFMALAVVRLIEIKTRKSLKKILKLFRKVTDARILNLLNDEEIILRTEISEDTKKILRLLGLPY
ncbi:IS1634 family transposase [Candidatus Gottesmanbacteria bacterium]|nr:IS1634 family transposase [Candidatus Gottesmanbacteria bacterium]